MHAGSSPVIRTKRGVAQLVARMVRDHEVVGSNPVTPTTSQSKAFGLAFLLTKKQETLRPAFPFSQKSFFAKNLFGSP